VPLYGPDLDHRIVGHLEGLGLLILKITDSSIRGNFLGKLLLAIGQFTFEAIFKKISDFGD
jgi:hypothetical protein